MIPARLTPVGRGMIECLARQSYNGAKAGLKIRNQHSEISIQNLVFGV